MTLRAARTGMPASTATVTIRTTTGRANSGGERKLTNVTATRIAAMENAIATTIAITTVTEIATATNWHPSVASDAAKASAGFYEPVGGFSGFTTLMTWAGWVASRFGGTYFGVFCLGFFFSRPLESLFPIPGSMPRVPGLWLPSERSSRVRHRVSWYARS